MWSWAPYLLDAALIALLVIFILIGKKVGFVKTAVRIVGFFAAIFLAFALSTPLSQLTYDVFLKSPVEKAVDSTVTVGDLSGVTDGIDKTLDAMPGFVSSLLEKSDLGTSEQWKEQLAEKVNGTVETAADAVKGLVRTAAVGVLKILLTVILAIVFFFIVTLLARLIDKIFDLPVLNGINALGGTLLGALEGIVAVLVAVCLIKFLSTVVEPETFFSAETVAKSHLTRWLIEINPLLK